MLKYLKSSVYSRLPFQLVTAGTLICFIFVAVVFIYGITMFKENDVDNGIYMNLSELPGSTSCSNPPYSDNLPLHFKYSVNGTDYEFKCRPPVLYQAICHFAIVVFLIAFLITSYVFGLLVRQRKGIILSIGYGVLSIAVFIFGVLDYVLVIRTKDFCDNGLENIKVEMPFDEVKCMTASYYVFATIEILTGVLGVIDASAIAFFFIKFYKEKKAKRAEAEKKYKKKT